MIPLALLAPIFLAAAAAIVVPLLVHLVHKEKREAIAFPSLMFLRKTPYPFSSRQKIRDWLLFLARCALIALTAFAFARPVFARQGANVIDDSSGREVVLLLDRSFSMRYGDRFAQARREARAVIDGLGAGDRLTVIAFDRRAAAVSEATNEKVQLRTAVDSIRPGTEATRYAPAVVLASRTLSSSERPRKELVVISDFQRSGWDLTDDVTIPAGTTVTTRDVSGASPVANHGVRAVDVRRDASGSADRVLVSARVVRQGDPERALAARLDVGGRTVAQATVALPRDGGATVSFGAVAVGDRAVPARVVLANDSLPGDDEFHFLLSRAPTLPVLVVEHPEALPERGVFLTRALEIGDAPIFDMTVRRADRVTATDLVKPRVVILADAGIPGGVGGSRLEAFVRAGGGLITALGERTSDRAWPAGGRALLPGKVAPPVDRLGQRGAVLGGIDRGHQVFSVFRGARSGDLSAARFFRYRPVDTTEGVLARFDDGAPALTEHQLGRGRVLTWGSSFDGYWNDLPRQPVFLPFLHQLVRYAGAYREVSRSIAVGQSVRPGDLVAGADGGAERWAAVSPQGRRVLVGGDGNPGALEVTEAGVWELRPSGSPGAQPVYVAANVDPAELDFATFDVLRLTNALAPTSGQAPSQDAQLTLTEREQRQSLWWYVLAVAAIILMVEGVLARRASTGRLEPV